MVRATAGSAVAVTVTVTAAKHQHISQKPRLLSLEKTRCQATWWLMVIKRIQICVLIDICTLDGSDGSNISLTAPHSTAQSTYIYTYFSNLQMWQSHHHHYSVYIFIPLIYLYGKHVHCHYHRLWLFDALSKTGRTKSYKHFPCRNVNAFTILAVHAVQYARFYISTSAMMLSLFFDLFHSLPMGNSTTQPLFPKIRVWLCVSPACYVLAHHSPCT